MRAGVTIPSDGLRAGRVHNNESEPLSERSTRTVELLAPAGGPEALVAAVNNGADAVYLGLGELNARRSATNFDRESLAEATRFAHLRDARVYLTANVVVLPGEFEGALALVDDAWAAGVDAVIVQDLGLLRVVREQLPEVRVHASTQIDAMNPASVKTLAALGVARVTLARELSLPAIRACAATGVEVESFLHGALCYSYSGQCLMSSLIGRRSANRGLCAQPCRLGYELLDESGELRATPGRHLLSPKDLAGIAHLPQLIDAGVSALKIEGRMKSPEYVAVVTGVYRAALDRALRDSEHFSVQPGEWELLEEAFSRGFTDAYLTDARGADLMSYTRPNNRGVRIGRVVGMREGRAKVDLERALEARDTLEVWTRSGRFAETVAGLVVDGRTVTSAPAGALAEIAFGQAVGIGDRVFRVASVALEEAARRTFGGAAAADTRATPVTFSVRLRRGEPLMLAAAAAGERAEVTGPVVEDARTRAVTLDEVVEHVGRLGGSGYRAESWDVDLDAGVGVGFSVLHGLRRDALAALDEARLRPWADRARRGPKIAAGTTRPRPAREVRVVVTAWDEEVARACVEAGADEVWLRVWGPPSGGLPEGVRPLLPRIAWPAEQAGLLEWANGETVTAGNLGLLAEAARLGPAIADWPLSVLNVHAARTVSDLGATMLWASPELSGHQLATLAAGSPVPVGATVWGRLELMVAEQCVLMAVGSCTRRCASCGRRAGWWRLRDQKGYEFPVTTDPSGRSHIMNAVTLDLTRALDEVLALGVAAVRVDFSDEAPARAGEILRAVRSAVTAVGGGAPAPETTLVEPATSGHFFRGLL